MKIKIRDIPTFYKILFPSIAITLMVTLTSTIFTYNKASEIIASESGNGPSDVGKLRKFYAGNL